VPSLLAHFTVTIFVLSVALVVIASIVLSTALDRVGAWLGFSSGLLGIITALGANSPEISSAITAFTSGNRDVGLGVVLGSNLFNLASLLGLSAVVAGSVRARTAVVALNGGVGLAALAVAGLLIYGVVGGALGLVLMALVFAPYVVLSALHPHQVEALRALPGPVRRFLAVAVAPTERREAEQGSERTIEIEAGEAASAPLAAISPATFEALTLVPALVAIVLGSIGMVDTALELGKRWHVPQTVIGALVLAALTGIPNAVAAVRLALRQRGAVVVSEALNSNTLNLVAGVGVPAFLIGLGSAVRFGELNLWWLVALTLLVLGLMLRNGRLGRVEGIVVIVAWVVFAAFTIATA
jgi:cation:H+ antiporter